MERKRKSHDKSIKEEATLISPPSGAESLFFAGLLDTSVDSASTLSEQLRQTDTSRSYRQQQQQPNFGRIGKSGSFHSNVTRGSNVSTDDFLSCVENASDFDGDTDSIDSNENNSNSPLATARSSSRFCMETIDDNNGNNLNNTMANSKFKKGINKTPVKAAPTTDVKPPLPDVALVETTAAAPTTTPADPPTTLIVTEDEQQMKVDPAEVVYGKAKDIFAWGKTVPVVSFFVGTSEVVAGKALGVVGTDLSQVDGKIESELTKLDEGILNPVIQAIAKVLIGVAGKSEETIKPIIDAILSSKLIGIFIKLEANERTPEAHTETPEVTATK